MTEALKKEIRSFIAAADRLVILGIGNPEKGDDGLGPLCTDLIQASLGNDLIDRVKIINAGVMPENYTGEIRKFKASHVLVIDAVIAGEKTGAIFKVDPDLVTDEDISTHRMPLKMLTRFFIENIGTKVLVIGIEPKTIDFDSEISKIVYKSTEILANDIISSLKST